MAVTGASGFLGGALVEAFASEGAQVVALARRDTHAPRRGVEFRAYDLDAAVPPLEGIGTLVHAAYVPDDFDRNVRGSGALFERCRERGIAVAFISSIRADSRGASEYARQKAAVEELLGDDGVSLRCGLIAGAGGLFARLHAAAERPVVPLVDGGNQPVQVVGANDVYNAIRIALAAGLRGHHAVVAEPALTLREVFELAGRRGRLFVPVPSTLVSLALRVARTLHVTLPVSEENLTGLRGSRYVPPSRALVAAGWRPRDARETVRAASHA